MKRAIFSLTLLAGLVAFGFAQQQPGGVSGWIELPNGTPAAGIWVQVTDRDTGESIVLQTDARGRYFSNALRGRRFSVRVVPAPAQEGGSTIRNFFRVNEQICTGGQPTMEELEKLKAEGVKSVVNLRRPSEYNAEEEAAKVKELGLRYFHIPFDTNAPKDEPVDEFLKVMADKSNLPVFIHCTVANRVGGFWLIRRVLVDGWTVEKAEEEAKKIGLTNVKTREFALDYIERHKPSKK
jgi:uncharacterized protein (TIGR01244 family)